MFGDCLLSSHRGFRLIACCVSTFWWIGCTNRLVPLRLIEFPMPLDWYLSLNSTTQDRLMDLFLSSVQPFGGALVLASPLLRFSSLKIDWRDDFDILGASCLLDKTADLLGPCVVQLDGIRRRSISRWKHHWKPPLVCSTAYHWFLDLMKCSRRDVGSDWYYLLKGQRRWWLIGRGGSASFCWGSRVVAGQLEPPHFLAGNQVV